MGDVRLASDAAIPNFARVSANALSVPCTFELAEVLSEAPAVLAVLLSQDQRLL